MRFPSAIDVAASVILSVTPRDSADSMLREQVKRRKLHPDMARETAEAVFAYFRWLGWLGEKELVRKRIAAALDLAARYEAKPDSFADADLVAKSVPQWIREEMEVTAAWLRAIMPAQKLWLRSKKGGAVELAARLDAQPGGVETVPDALQYKGTTDLFSTPEYLQGLFEVQDLSSQVVGLMCAPEPGSTWWDACAGEGGKTLHLSDLMGNKGMIWASDRAEWRLRKLKKRAGRAGVFNYRSETWDGSAKLPTRTKFDGILVDAPCSGVGTWQRNPDARWTLSPTDVAELSVLQKQILGNVAGSLKPGGKLIYSVCTLTRAETTGVAEWFGEKFPELKPLPLKNLVKPGAPDAPSQWIWPQDRGSNGMFIAAWTRS